MSDLVRNPEDRFSYDEAHIFVNAFGLMSDPDYVAHCSFCIIVIEPNAVSILYFYQRKGKTSSLEEIICRKLASISGPLAFKTGNNFDRVAVPIIALVIGLVRNILSYFQKYSEIFIYFFQKCYLLPQSHSLDIIYTTGCMTDAVGITTSWEHLQLN